LATSLSAGIALPLANRAYGPEGGNWPGPAKTSLVNGYMGWLKRKEG